MQKSVKKDKKRVPIIPLPLEIAKKASKNFLGIGELISKSFPNLRWELQQAEFDVEPREWIAISIQTTILYFIMVFLCIFVAAAVAHVEIIKSFFVSIAAGAAIGGSVFFYIALYPKFKIRKKIKSIEANLPYAMHHMLVEIRSGVPLFNVLVSISKGDYELLSKETGKIVDEINTGKSEVEALEKVARENPSLHFRRVVWQLVNALKSGADISVTIKELVDSITADQRIAIRKYGSQLNPIALMYMMLAVIFPTLGITFLLVLSTFMGFAFDLGYVLFGILVLLVFFQFMIAGLIKSKRPVGI